MLTYNGVQLSYVRTLALDQGPVYDPSGVDQLYTKFTLRVQAVIFPNGYPSNPGEDAATTARRVTHMLTQPRGNLTYAVGGTTYLTATADTDANNGPLPDAAAFRVTRVLQGSFVVNFSVTCCLTDCPEGTSKEFLSLRWADTISHDRNGLATKRRSGTVIVSSNGEKTVDDLRAIVLPAVDPGFKRETRDWTIDESGLRGRFVFVDKQKHRLAPEPALAMRGKIMESCPLKGGLRKGHLTLRLDGAPGVTGRELLDACIRAAMSQVFASSPFTTDDGRVMIGGGIESGLGEDDNYAQLSLEWNMKPAGPERQKGRDKGVIGRAWDQMMGNPPKPVPVVPNKEGKDKAAIPMFGSWIDTPVAGASATRAVDLPANGFTTARKLKLLTSLLLDPCTADAGLGTRPESGDGGTDTILEGRPGFSGGLDGVLEGRPGEMGLSDLDSLDGTVTVSTVSPDDFSAYYDDEEDGGEVSADAVYDHCVITCLYEDDSGLAQMPGTGVGDNGRKAKFVQVNGGLATCSVAWSVSRIGAAPEIPSRDPKDDNAHYLRGRVEPEQIDVAADGVTPVHSINGCYWYGFEDPDAVRVASPIPPWLSFGDLKGLAAETAADTSAEIALTGGGTNPFDEDAGGTGGADTVGTPGFA